MSVSWMIFRLQKIQVVIDHKCGELLEGGLVFPVQFALSESCVTEKVFRFAGALKSGVESVVVMPIKADVLESEVDEIAYAVGSAGG